MWYEDRSSKNMAASVIKRYPENIANGNSLAATSLRDDLANRLDIELAKANNGQKFPVKRYKTRTNSEWLKTFGSRLPQEAEQRMDYILVYKKKSDGQNPAGLHNDDSAHVAREKFMDALEDEGFDVLKEEIGDNVYLKIHTPFWRLCKEAEREGLKMPIKDVSKHFFYVFA